MSAALDDGRERRLELGAAGGRLDLHPHEEAAGVEARELLALGDVAPRRDDRAADRVHDAGPVGAGRASATQWNRWAGAACGVVIRPE